MNHSPRIGDAGIDTTTPHNARVWNYWLGGKDNFAVDRAMGEEVRSMFPLIVDVARADRAFLGRIVGYLAGERGIRQFLDIGTGLPTAQNTHQVAQEIAPDARIVYVDNDPMVLAHARTLLSGTAQGVTAYVDADAHDPAGILCAAADTLDLDRPVGVLLLGILNFILDDDEAERVVSSLVAAIPSGSYVAITHPTLEVGGEGNCEAIAHFNAHATPPITARSSEQVRRFFTDLQLLEPGVVPCSQWRPGDVEVGSVAPVPQLAGVGVKE